MKSVSRRALIIGFALIPLNTLFLVKSVYMWGGFTGGALFHNTVATLFALALINQGLKQWRPQWTLRPGEMLTIYALLGMSTGLTGSYTSLGGSLLPCITYPFWYATAENRWRELIWPYLPVWLTAQDRTALESFYAGQANPYTWRTVQVWAGPAFWWATFMGAMFWVCLCFNSIIRRRWSDEEKLPFPFTILPVQVVEERSGLFRNKGWWSALSLSFTIGIWNALAAAFPSLPRIPVSVDLYSYAAGSPLWSAVRAVWGFGWEPGYFGLFYLVPLDLLISLFVFELLWIAESILAVLLGWSRDLIGVPYIDMQMAGGFIALAVAFVWLDRHYFVQVARKVLGLGSALGDDKQEAFSYRTAALGALLGLAYLWWFWGRAQVPLGMLTVFLCSYLAFTMLICRVRAQVGSPVHEFWMATPDILMRYALGSTALGPRIEGMFALLNPYLLGIQDSNPAPIQLETLKMAEGGRMEKRRIAAAMAIAVPITVFFYFWGYLHYGYDLGTASGKVIIGLYDQVWMARWAADNMANMLRQPAARDSGRTLAIAFGCAVTLLLFFVKLRLQWWPLHPVAFPFANSWVIYNLTPVIIIVILVKFLLMRYGGLRTHRAALPFFLGLLVGSFVAATLRAVTHELFGIGI